MAGFERDEFMWNAYKSALQESAREHNIPAFTEMVMDDDLQPADTWLLLVRAMYDAEEARVMDEWVKRCEQGETTVTNVTASTAPAPTSPPTATAIIWSIENRAAFGSRSITSADKTQRWTWHRGRPPENSTSRIRQPIRWLRQSPEGPQKIRTQSSMGNPTSLHGRRGRRIHHGRRKNTLSMCDMTRRCS